MVNRGRFPECEPVRMSIHSLLLCVPLIMVLSGCAGTFQVTRQLDPSLEGAPRAYIQVSPVGAMSRRMEISDNGRLVGYLGYNAPLVWTRAAGPMTLVARAAHTIAPIRLTTQAGQQYGFTAGYSSAMGGYYLRPVGEIAGMAGNPDQWGVAKPEAVEPKVALPAQRRSASVSADKSVGSKRSMEAPATSEAPPAWSPDDAVQRLRTLKVLLDEKTITEDEYQTRRKAILDAL